MDSQEEGSRSIKSHDFRGTGDASHKPPLAVSPLPLDPHSNQSQVTGITSSSHKPMFSLEELKQKHGSLPGLGASSEHHKPFSAKGGETPTERTNRQKSEQFGSEFGGFWFCCNTK